MLHIPVHYNRHLIEKRNSSLKETLSLTVMHHSHCTFSGPTKIPFCILSPSGKQSHCHQKAHSMFRCTFSFKGKFIRLVVTLRCYIPLTNKVRGTYCKLRPLFFPIVLWPKCAGHKAEGKIKDL